MPVIIWIAVGAGAAVLVESFGERAADLLFKSDGEGSPTLTLIGGAAIGLAAFGAWRALRR